MVNEWALLILALVTCIVVASVKVGARWLRICLIFPLVSIILHRVDALTTYYLGFDLVPVNLSYLLLYAVLGSIIAAFIMAWQRRKEMQQVEAIREARRIALRERIKQLEAMREKNEQLIGMNWDYR